MPSQNTTNTRIVIRYDINSNTNGNNLINDMYEKCYCVFAMKRTGHHGIMNWLFQQMEGGVAHLNFGRINNDRLLSVYRPILVKKGNITKNFVVNFEDFDLDNLKNINLKIIHPFNTSKETKKIMILRDAKNWLASLLKGAIRNNHCRNEMIVSSIEKYKKFMSEYAKENNDFVWIIYDKWFVDKEYRKKISDQLNLDFNDDGLEIVSNYGGGSSFDGKKYNNMAQKMDVLNRWKIMEDNIFYKKYIEMLK